jgi:hypothetical protein
MLLPVLPWIIDRCTCKAQTICGGEVHGLYSGKLPVCSCSSENWLLMIEIGTETRYFLENPLSRFTLPLPSPGKLQRPDGWLP